MILQQNIYTEKPKGCRNIIRFIQAKALPDAGKHKLTEILYFAAACSVIYMPPNK